MKKINILIIEDNIELTKILKNKIDIKYIANDGKKALEILKDNLNNIDIIILDLILPKKDGIYILKYLKDNNIDIPLILTTSFGNDLMLNKISKYNINYVLLKPYKLEELKKTIEYVYIEDKNINYIPISNNIIKILHELGIPSNIKGYQYLKEGITLSLNNLNLLNKVTKNLYPSIAFKNNTTTASVESAIRHAIEIGWGRGDWNLMDELFGHSIDIEKSKPTNAGFISTVVEYLKLYYKKP